MERSVGRVGAIFYRLICDDDESVRWYIPGSSPADDQVLGPFVDEAFARLEPPVPEVITSPPRGTTVLTGFPMYLAVAPDTVDELSGTVSAGEFSVTATVRPVATRFSPQDGSDAFTCDGAGSTWSEGERPTPDDCTHTFTVLPTTGGDHQLSGQVIYQAAYTVTGPILAGDYDLGTLDGPETTITIPVTERRAVRTTSLD